MKALRFALSIEAFFSSTFSTKYEAIIFLVDDDKTPNADF